MSFLGLWISFEKALIMQVQPIAPPTNPYQSTSRHLKQVVAYEFHPVEPLVLCLLHTPTHPAQLTLYYRA